MAITKKVIRLGIDFGSSSTAIVATVKNAATNKVETTPVIFEMADEVLSFPSLIVTKSDKDETRLYFDDALDADPKYIKYSSGNLKENLLDQKGLEEAKEYFRELLKRLQGTGEVRYDFSELEKICFGHPAHYDIGSVDFFRDAMVELLSSVFDKKVSPKLKAENIIGISEPILAAYAFNHAHSTDREGYTSKISHNDLVMVIDLGGHTVDLAIMQAKKSNGIVNLTPYASPNSIESKIVPMGKRITEKICQEVYGRDWRFDEKIDLIKCEFFNMQAEGRGSATKPAKPKYESDFKRTVRVAGKEYAYDKFRLVADSGKITDAVKDGVKSVGIFGGAITINLEDAIIKKLHKIIWSYLETQPKRSIHHVLLTGGTSCIPAIRNSISTTLNPWWAKEGNYSVFTMEKAVWDCKGTAPLTSAFGGVKVSLGWDIAVALGAGLVAGEAQGCEITEFSGVGLRSVTVGDPAEELYSLRERLMHYIRAENESLLALGDGLSAMEGGAALSRKVAEIKEHRSRILFKNED